MRGPTAVLDRFVGGIPLAAAFLLGCPALLAAQDAGADPAVRGAPQVELATEGTFASFRPVARVEIDRPGYVALFEVEPGVGATLLHPDDPVDPEPLAAGRHELRLNGLQTAVRRQLMVWHLGWAFAHRPLLVPENHLVAVVSDRPLDVSGLRSRRIFKHAKGSAGVGEVTRALLAEVAGDLPPGAWDAAHASYDKFRDPWLLSTTGPWYDAPFLPLAQELVFSGWPPAGSVGVLFSCGPAFAATGQFFTARTAHDLRRLCHGAVADRRTLAAMSWQDPWSWARETAERQAHGEAGPAADADGSGAASARPEEPLPEEVREALRRIADATERRRSGRGLRPLREMELLGEAMSARGLPVDTDRLHTLRWKAEARARVLRRIGASSRGSGGLPVLDAGADARRSAGVRGSRGGRSGADRSARPARRDVGRPSPERVRRRPPAPSPRKPVKRKPRTSGGSGSSGGGS